MTDALAQVLNWLYGIWPSYAGAIVLLTLIIMVLVTPLTLKSTRSMMEMQKHQPELKKLQAQYRDDRQRLNEELMAFYKEHSINPMGGCIPLLVQMPVFFALYSVLRGLTRRETDVGFDFGWVGGQLAQGISPQTSPPDPNFNFDPAYLAHDTKLWQSLHSTNEMQSWGLDLSESASKALSTEGLLHALPYFALIAVVAVTGIVQQRQIQGRNPNAEVNPQQQMIMKFLPIMLPLFSFALPSGLVLYFAVSNSYRCAQQWWISRSIYGITKEDRIAAREAAKAAPKSSKGTGSKGTASKAGAGKAGAGKSGATRGSSRTTPKKTAAGGAKREVIEAEVIEDGVDLGKGRPTPKRGEPREKSTTTKASSTKRSSSKSTTSKGATRGSGSDGSRGTAAPPPKPVTAQPRARKRKR